MRDKSAKANSRKEKRKDIGKSERGRGCGGIRVRSERDGGEGTSKGRPLARSELGLAEKSRLYLLSLDLCRIRNIPVRGVVGWRSRALLL